LGCCVRTVGQRHAGKDCCSILERLASATFYNLVLALRHGGADRSRDVDVGVKPSPMDRHAGMFFCFPGCNPSVFPHPRSARASSTSRACCGALMPGHAFSIEDALIANRWAERLAPCNCRIAITPRYKDAEEIIEVYIRSPKAPTLRMYRTSHAVLIKDCVGLTLSFATLADALLAMAPLLKSVTREMLKGAGPAWLSISATCPVGRRHSRWSQPGRFIRTTARIRPLASRVKPTSEYVSYSRNRGTKVKFRMHGSLDRSTRCDAPAQAAAA